MMRNVTQSARTLLNMVLLVHTSTLNYPVLWS